MNLYVELSGKPHYNRVVPRVRQGETRANKGGYRPRFARATHHVQAYTKKTNAT